MSGYPTDIPVNAPIICYECPKCKTTWDCPHDRMLGLPDHVCPDCLTEAIITEIIE